MIVFLYCFKNIFNYFIVLEFKWLVGLLSNNRVGFLRSNFFKRILVFLLLESMFIGLFILLLLNFNFFRIFLVLDLYLYLFKFENNFSLCEYLFMIFFIIGEFVFVFFLDILIFNFFK